MQDERRSGNPFGDTPPPRQQRPTKSLDTDDQVGDASGSWVPPRYRHGHDERSATPQPSANLDDQTPGDGGRADGSPGTPRPQSTYTPEWEEPRGRAAKTLDENELTDTGYRPWTHKQQADEDVERHRPRGLSLPERPRGRYREDQVLDPRSRIRADGSYAGEPVHDDAYEQAPPANEEPSTTYDEELDEVVDVEDHEPVAANPAPSATSLASVAWITIGVVAGVKLLLHLLVNAFDGYGIFRDEYYYLACANHLAWGYVDQPPFSLFMLKLQTLLMGDSLFAIRVFPALLGAGTVIGMGLLAREFGGKRFAQLLAALLGFFAPVFVSFAGISSMNIWDLAIWLGVILLVARWINGAPNWTWLIIGGVLGLGLLNKISVLYLGAGLLAGLMVSPRRRVFLTIWPWAAAAIAVLMFLPHILWQIGHDWPTLEFMHNARTYKNAEMNPLQWIGAVIMQQHPLFLPLWALGGVALALAGVARRHFWALVAFATVLFVLLVSGGAKPYYAATAFIPLWATAGIPLERWFAGRKDWVLWLVLGWVVVGGALVLPLNLPILKPEGVVALQKAIGISPPQQERGPQGALQQFLADRFGWKELADKVAAAYHSLPPLEQSRTVVFGQNYGQAASLEYYREDYNLPPILSAHNSYYLWGTGGYNASIVIVIGDNRERLLELFDRVDRAGTKKCQWCMPGESNLPIWICRGAKYPMEVLWPEIKLYI